MGGGRRWGFLIRALSNQVKNGPRSCNRHPSILTIPSLFRWLAVKRCLAFKGSVQFSDSLSAGHGLILVMVVLLLTVYTCTPLLDDELQSPETCRQRKQCGPLVRKDCIWMVWSGRDAGRSLSVAESDITIGRCHFYH